MSPSPPTTPAPATCATRARIARQRGLDPDRWFGNVEKAMLLKQRPEFHRKTRYGYARAQEPVAYVRAIRDRYEGYVQSGAGS